MFVHKETGCVFIGSSYWAKKYGYEEMSVEDYNKLMKELDEKRKTECNNEEETEKEKE